MAERVVKSFKVLIGLEIHVQLATATKMFTSAPNGATNFGADPNSLVDPVILGLPGVLPVMKEPMTTIVAGMFSIFKATKYPQESWELVKYLIDPESSIDMITSGTWMPSYKSWYTENELLSRWTENLDARPSGYKDAIVEVLLNSSHQTPTGYVKNFSKIMDVVSRRLAEATAIDLNGLRVKLLAILQSHGGWRT